MFDQLNGHVLTKQLDKLLEGCWTIRLKIKLKGEACKEFEKATGGRVRR